MRVVPTADEDPWPDDFVAFYRREFPWAVRTARLIVGRVDLAEDVVQDVFVRIARRWDGVDSPQAYLRRSVVNGALRSAERQRREREYVAAQRPEVVPPIEIAETLAALEVLPARGRAAIVLRYYEDLPDGEIAELLGCRPATVRSLIHRALKRLHKELS